MIFFNFIYYYIEKNVNYFFMQEMNQLIYGYVYIYHFVFYLIIFLITDFILINISFEFRNYFYKNLIFFIRFDVKIVN